MKKLPFLLVLLLLGCRNEISENNISSILVSKDSDLKYEAYFNGSVEGEMVNVQSITKSIVSILIGVAIDEGSIQNDQVSIEKYFPNLAADKKQITIEHLLNHTSGIEWKGYLEHDEFTKSKNPSNYVLSKSLEHEPGLEYNYNSGGTHLLSVILTQVSGKSTLEYAREKLFTPLGINQIKWGKLMDGIYDGAGFSLEMLPKDLVKIGGLVLRGSQVSDGNLVSNTWVQKMLNQQLKRETKWGLRNSNHGYGWYSALLKDQKIYYSMGYGGQFILVIPDRELIIVSTHNHDTPKGIEQQVDFLKETFPQLVQKYGS